jgi:hypothetical protein
VHGGQKPKTISTSQFNSLICICLTSSQQNYARRIEGTVAGLVRVPTKGGSCVGGGGVERGFDVIQSRCTSSEAFSQPSILSRWVAAGSCLCFIFSNNVLVTISPAFTPFFHFFSPSPLSHFRRPAHPSKTSDFTFLSYLISLSFLL